ncbi:MAG: S8/S53 family peptidase [Actinobacteria bacterium]|nr:S8/S53 family peptidase [Actinomycetota bacterium]
MRPGRRHPRWAVVALAASMTAACGGSALSVDGTSSTTTATTAAILPVEPTFSYRVDATVADPSGAVEVVANDTGSSRFTPGRIVLVFADPADLDAVLDRYDGTVVHSFSTGDYGVPGPTYAVIEVDLSTVDPDEMPGAMTALGIEGSSAFGSEDGARLAAIVAVERAAGRQVSLEWRTETTEIPFSTQEASTTGGRRGWSPNAYELSYYQRDSVQGFGVAEAWSLMYYAGVLGNRVPIAVIDRGFEVDDDFADPVTYAMDPSYLEFGESDDGYHGYETSSIAMAIPDNGYGIAGVAGVVAEPILIQRGASTDTDAIEALLQARALGAEIVSMSFITAVIDEWAYVADLWDPVTSALADDGVLMFASSGNGGGNLDEAVAEREGLIGTRPCQAPGVICVGGLAEDSIDRDEHSVYGEPGGSVPIFGPYCVHTIPPQGGGTVFWTCGTSLSAPFVAGVAALVWASNPDLTADQVWAIMEATAHPGRWPRVNAYGAVADALPPAAFVSFAEPAPDSGHELANAITLAAVVAIPTDLNTSSAEVTIRFASDLDGPIDETTWTVVMEHDEAVSTQRVSTVTADLSEGDHVLTVTATYGDAEVSDIRIIHVGNSPPTDLVITQPDDGDLVCEGSTVLLRGDAFDINEQLGLSNSAFRWSSSIDGPLGRGRNRSEDGLSVGEHVITMRVVDAGGLESSETVGITVWSATYPACRDAPPDARINRPLDEASFYVDYEGDDYETGVDEDGAYVVVTLRVRVSDDRDEPEDLQIDFYVTPDEPDAWVGSGRTIETRLHLPDGETSQAKTIRVVVYDSGGNVAEDEIRVFVSRFV